MPRPSRGLRRSWNRAEIARLTLEGQSPAQIAPLLRISEVKVGRVLAELREEWLATVDLDRWRSHDLDTLVEVETELRVAFKRSGEVRHSARELQREGVGAYTSTAINTEKLTANPDFLELHFQCVALRAEISRLESERSAREGQAEGRIEGPLQAVALDQLLGELERRRVNVALLLGEPGAEPGPAGFSCGTPPAAD